MLKNLNNHVVQSDHHTYADHGLSQAPLVNRDKERDYTTCEAVVDSTA